MNKKPYIIVIDDDQDDVDLLTECFKKFPYYTVCSFNKGYSFIDFINHLNADYPSLIIIDLNLPDIAGVEVLAKIKANSPFESVPAVVFSTGGTPAEKEVCEKLNTEIFKKPSSIMEWQYMIAIMASHCEQRALKGNEEQQVFR
jgi:CheY-like chemotaxis protein